MNWETIITASAVASLVSGVFMLVKTLLDNQAKKNDSIRLFKYTKLYEILSDWYNKADELGGKAEEISYADEGAWENFKLDIMRNEPIRVEQLKKAYKLAKPLISLKHQKLLDEKFGEVSKIRWSIFEKGRKEHVLHVNEKESYMRMCVELEEMFETFIRKELEDLMK